MQYKSVLFIDPDTNGLYAAHFLNGEFSKIINIKVNKLKIMSMRLKEYHRVLSVTCHLLGIEAIYSEDQFFYNRATHKSIKKLAYFTGLIKCVCGEKNIPHGLITPQEWKGSLPDELIKERVNKLIDVPKKTNIHCYDAIGMGLYLAGKF